MPWVTARHFKDGHRHYLHRAFVPETTSTHNGHAHLATASRYTTASQDHVHEIIWEDGEGESHE